MFKSSFYKYLTAFIIIILVSFLFLSGIVTSTIRSQIMSDKKDKLEMSTTIVADYFESHGIENLRDYIASGEGDTPIALVPIINFDYSFNILLTDANGVVLLSTAQKNDNGEPSILGELGRVDVTKFRKETIDGNEFLTRTGIIEDITDEKSMIYGKAIEDNGRRLGYVFAFTSTVSDDGLISITRRTVINSSLWVMLAAVIATYFITERITYPLKSMKNATKKFAAGDFKERVEVVGNDEIAELAQAFNNMAESLENLEKMRNSFLASVSHDLRTPMTTISGFIDGINSGAIPPEKHSHYLGIISVEVHRLSRLVSQLLDISRLESGDRKFVFADFDIAEVARLIIISLEQKINEKHLDVEFNTVDDEVIVSADKDAIYQVLYNLCDNAIKFAKDGGVFRLTIEKNDTKKFLVTVYDEGQTVSDEDAKHLFDRFYKTDKSRGLDKNGVGLGLYICRTIVEAHGETIFVEPHSEGCSFGFTLKPGISAPKHKGQGDFREDF